MIIGLALAGGVARGLAHIGVLQVLEENGILPERIAGTSAGSIVGAARAAGMDPYEIQYTAEHAEWWFLAKPVPFGRGLLSSEGIEKWVEKVIPARTFADLKIPLAVAAVDFLTGEEVILTAGPLALAVRASCNVPGIYEPVPWQGRFLVDGGLVKNIPVSPVKDLGADFVIAVDLHSQALSGELPTRPSGALLRTSNLLMRPLEEAEMKQANVVIQPLLGQLSPLAFKEVEAFVRAGREAAEKVLPEILSQLSQLS